MSQFSDAPGTQALTVWTVRGRDASRTPLWEVARAVLTDHRPAAITGVAEVDVPGRIEGARALSFATATRRVTLVDAPPSAALIDAAIDGEVRFDAVIVTVADEGSADGGGDGGRAEGGRGDDGEQPVDRAVLRPALLIARQLGIDVAVIALDGEGQRDARLAHRRDRAERMGSVALIDDEGDEAESGGANGGDATERDMRELMNEHGFDGDDTPFVRVSLGGAIAGEDAGLESLAALAAAVAVNVAAPESGRDGPVFLPVESVGATPALDALLASGGVPRPDAVVSGRIERGRLRESDGVEIVGFGETQHATVSGIVAAESLVDEVHAGDAVSVCLRGVTTDDVRPGHVVAAAGSVRSHVHFEADAWLAFELGDPSADAIEGPHDVSVLGTTVGGRVSLPEGAVTIASDATLRIQVDLDSAIAVEVDQTFVIRRNGDVVGTGQITGILDDGDAAR